MVDMVEQLKKFSVAEAFLATIKNEERIRLTKSEAGYGYPAKGESNCGKCNAFLVWGACRKVIGMIDPEKVCDLYEGGHYAGA